MYIGKDGTALSGGQISLFFSEATDLFRFRTIPGVRVTTDCFILCDGDRFDITSVEDVKGKGMYIEVLAKKVTPSG